MAINLIKKPYINFTINTVHQSIKEAFSLERKKNSSIEKAEEVFNFNSYLVNSKDFEKNHNEVNDILNMKKLKEPYVELLKKLIQLPSDSFYNYKNKAVIYIDNKFIEHFNISIVERGIVDLLRKDLITQLIEIGLLKRISYSALENEYLGSNNLKYVSLKKKKNEQDNFLIIFKLDDDRLNRILNNSEPIKNNRLKRKEVKEDPENIKGKVDTIISNHLNEKEDFFEVLNYLEEEAKKLQKVDENHKLYKLFNNTELIYTYTLFVSQCRLHKEIELSKIIGRPAFIWRFDHLKTKFKRMHPLKNLSFYMETIDHLVEIGLLKRVSFSQIDMELLDLIDERDKKKKPDLYIFPFIDINTTVNSQTIYSSIVTKLDSTMPSVVESGGILNNEENIVNKKKEDTISMFQAATRIEENQIESIDEQKSFLKRDIKWVENVKERVNYNIDKINSEFFMEIYKPINDYLINNNLKSYYNEILSCVLEAENIYFVESKNKSIFYLNEYTLRKVYKKTFPVTLNESEPQELFFSLIKIGIFEVVSPQILAFELGVSVTELVKDIRNNFQGEYAEGENLYVLKRLNEKVLKTTYFKIKEIQKNKSFDLENNNKENNMSFISLDEVDLKETKNLLSIDYSITESALDILIESEIEGNKVTIPKHYFDKLIKAILGEVP